MQLRRGSVDADGEDPTVFCSGPPWGRTLVDPTGFCGSGCASGAVQLQCIYNFCVWSGHSQS